MKEKQIAIYHTVRPNELFEESVNILFGLVKTAQKSNPGKQRALYLDIEGHKNDRGGFDHDMREIQIEFVTGFLMKYLSEAIMPLGKISNPNQNDNIPDVLDIRSL